MSGTKRFVSQFVVLAIALVIIHWVMATLFTAKILFLPTLITGMGASFVYVAHSPAWPILAITIFHLLIFTILNIYLLTRAARNTILSPQRAGIPSAVFTVLLAALSIRYWFWPIAHSTSDGTLGGLQAGLHIQGITYVWCYGILNLAVFIAAALVLYILMRKSRPPITWLVYNWSLYVLLFVVLFPWLGGYP